MCDAWDKHDPWDTRDPVRVVVAAWKPGGTILEKNGSIQAKSAIRAYCWK
jgi:hypothetical protein